MSRSSGDFEEELRHRLVGLLHAGRVQAGDRLESIRKLARDRGIDHRMVAAAYRALEVVGLVEIRGSSGVYVAHQDGASGLDGERVRWVTEVLREGWKRGWSRREVGRIVRRAGVRTLRCACIESNEDHLVAFASELASDFDLSVKEVYVDPDLGSDQISAASLSDVDIVVTSVFHADLARKLSGTISSSIIVLTIHPEYSARVDARLKSGRTTTVAVDPGYRRRGEEYLKGTIHETNVRLLTLDEADQLGLDLERPDVLLTRAARRRLGLEEFHLIAPPPGVISPASASALLHEITRLSIL